MANFLKKLAQATSPAFLVGSKVGKKGKLQQQIDDLIANRPKYEEADEYRQNQAMAYANLMGRDQGIIQQEENLDQSVADAAGNVLNVSNSTGAVLDTLSGIYDNKNKAFRDLAMDEAAINQAKRAELYGANIARAEEKDKAWNYNTNEPYQLKLESLLGKQKNRRELLAKGIDSASSIAALFATGGMSAGLPRRSAV